MAYSVMKIKIQSMKSDEIVDAGHFLKKVFNESVAEDYSNIGIIHFYDIIGVKSMEERLFNGSLINVAKIDNRIIGYIEITDSNHIYLLFVENEFHRKGIGRVLIEYTLNLLKNSNPELDQVTVNSTLSAVNIYNRLGFKKIADFQMKNEIISYPMSLILK